MSPAAYLQKKGEKKACTIHAECTITTGICNYESINFTDDDDDNDDDDDDDDDNDNDNDTNDDDDDDTNNDVLIFLTS